MPPNRSWPVAHCHYSAQRRALLDRVERFEPAVESPSDLRRRAATLQPGGLTGLAREVAALQIGRNVSTAGDDSDER